MKTKKERKYLKKYWKGIFANIKSFIKTHNQEDLHQFRVNVKKLKSLLVLFQSGRGTDKLLRRFKPVRKVFRKAGDIRNAHVNLQLCNQYHIDNDQFEKEQMQTAERGTFGFCGDGSRHIKKLKKARKKINSGIHDLEKKSIYKFYDKNLKEISGFFEAPVFDESLHECRKKIKFLLHNHEPSVKALKKKVILDITYLDQLQESIGKWHDNAVAMELLTSSGTDDELVAGKINMQTEELQAQIVESSQDFDRKAMVKL